MEDTAGGEITQERRSLQRQALAVGELGGDLHLVDRGLEQLVLRGDGDGRSVDGQSLGDGRRLSVVSSQLQEDGRIGDGCRIRRFGEGDPGPPRWGRLRRRGWAG